MIRKILSLSVLLLSALPVYAANPYSQYGVTDYQYGQGFYSMARLTVFQECMKPHYAAFSEGKIKSYDTEKEQCNISSWTSWANTSPKEAPGSSSAFSENVAYNECNSQCISDHGKAYNSCMTSCVGDPAQYGGDGGLRAAARNKCSDKCSPVAPVTECTKQCVETKRFEAGNKPLPQVQKTSKPEEPLSAAGKKYQDRYVAKCMDAYKNNPGASACCTALAVEDANAMQKKGVFDTETTAEIPIIVDENKCKPKEYKYDCSETAALGGDKDSCRDYINRCLEMGKWLDGKEDSRKKLCETDYMIKKPLELSTREKYMSICTKSANPKDAEEKVSVAARCGADYYSGAREYRDRCVASLNQANYNAFSNWFIQFRAFVFKNSKAKYQEQSKECLKRYDAALTQQLAG